MSDSRKTKAQLIEDLRALRARVARLERQRAECETIRDTLRFQTMLLDQIGDAITATDLKGRIRYVNAASARITGRTPGELIGRPVEVFARDPASCARQREIVERTLADGEWRGEVVNQRPDGSESLLDCRTWVLRDETGEPVGLCGVSADITQRKRAEEEVHESQYMAQTLLDAAVAAAFLLDADGRIVALNQVAAAHVGRPAEALRGRIIFDVLDAAQRPARRARLEEVLTTRRALRYEDEHDGRIFDVRVCPVPCSQGRVRRVAVFAHDITERKQIEAELARHRHHLGELVRERTAKLDAANARLRREVSERRRAEGLARERQVELAHASRLSIMGEMASGLAHELNQPLGAILSAAQGGQRVLRAVRPAPGVLADVLDCIASEAQRGGEIIRRMRRFVHKQPRARTVIDLNGVVREAAEFMRPETRRRGVTLEVGLWPHALPLYADPVEVQQVLLNLMRNGLEAMEQTPAAQRVLAIKTALVDGNATAVTVRDAGCGLSGAALRDAFDPFFTTKPDGMGMGLAISRTIIEAHGGRVWVAAHPAGGSTFHIRLPALNGAGRNES